MKANLDWSCTDLHAFAQPKVWISTAHTILPKPVFWLLSKVPEKTSPFRYLPFWTALKSETHCCISPTLRTCTFLGHVLCRSRTSPRKCLHWRSLLLPCLKHMHTGRRTAKHELQSEACKTDGSLLLTSFCHQGVPRKLTRKPADRYKHRTTKTGTRQAVAFPSYANHCGLAILSSSELGNPPHLPFLKKWTGAGTSQMLHTHWCNVAAGSGSLGTPQICLCLHILPNLASRLAELHHLLVMKSHVAQAKPLS